MQQIKVIGNDQKFTEFTCLTNQVRHEIDFRNQVDLFRKSRSANLDLINCGLVQDVVSRGDYHTETLQLFLEALRRGRIQVGDSSVIVGFFSVPYIQQLQFESIVMRAMPRPDWLNHFRSNAAAVYEISSSHGFQNQSCVAIFPEHLVGRAPTDLGDPIFYLINRFVDRTNVTTMRFIVDFVENPSFMELAALDSRFVSEILTMWVHFHEHFHNLGPRPLHSYLKQKSKRSAAAIEELRADLQVILHLYNSDTLVSRRASKLILCERAFRYAITHDPIDNYDAISSQVLTSYLLRSRTISISKSGKVRFCEDWIKAIEQLEAEILALESASSAENLTNNLVGFARHWGNFRSSNYELLPLFENVRRIWA